MDGNIQKTLSDVINKKSQELLGLAKKESIIIDKNEVIELENIKEEKIKLQKEIEFLKEVLF